MRDAGYPRLADRRCPPAATIRLHANRSWPAIDTAVSNGVCTVHDVAPSSNDRRLAFVHSWPSRDGAVSARPGPGSPVISRGQGRANTTVAG